MRIHKGDLTQMGSWNFAYDAQGNLLRASNSDTNVNVNASYFRDVDGHRAVKQVNGTQTLFFNLGSLQLEKYEVSSGIASSTIFEPGTDRPLAEVATNGAVTYYHQDVLGNVVLLTSATGAIVESYSYDAWGKVCAKDGTGAVVTSTPISRFLFTGREYDPETGLYDYRARAYSPNLGRFLQMDPIDFAGGDVNIFRYCGNSPLDWTDPSGLAGGLVSGADAGSSMGVPSTGYAMADSLGGGHPGDSAFAAQANQTMLGAAAGAGALAGAAALGMAAPAATSTALDPVVIQAISDAISGAYLPDVPTTVAGAIGAIINNLINNPPHLNGGE